MGGKELRAKVGAQPGSTGTKARTVTLFCSKGFFGYLWTMVVGLESGGPLPKSQAPGHQEGRPPNYYREHPSLTAFGAASKHFLLEL